MQRKDKVVKEVLRLYCYYYQGRKRVGQLRLLVIVIHFTFMTAGRVVVHIDLLLSQWEGENLVVCPLQLNIFLVNGEGESYNPKLSVILLKRKGKEERKATARINS